MEYTIVNLVASANLNATLDLYNLAITIPNIEYEPEQFPGAILKLKEPKVSILLFKNGKIICSGASNEAQISLAIFKASKLIHEIQKSVKIQKDAEFQVVNLVATANLNMTLDLFKTAMELDNVEYEPEQFPGAILRITEPKLTLLLFKNGKLICAGAKREELLREGLKKAAELIRSVNKESKEKEEEEPEEEEEEPKAPAKAPLAKAPAAAKAAAVAAPAAYAKPPAQAKKPAKVQKAAAREKKAVKPKPAAKPVKKAKAPKKAKKTAAAKHAKPKKAKAPKKAHAPKPKAGKAPAAKKPGLFGRLLGKK